MDESEPAVSAPDACHERVAVCVLEGLAYADEPEGGDKETKRGAPGAQRLCGDLAEGAEGQHGAEFEILREVRVGQGGGEPAGEAGGISANYQSANNQEVLPRFPGTKKTWPLSPTHMHDTTAVLIL